MLQDVKLELDRLIVPSLPNYRLTARSSAATVEIGQPQAGNAALKNLAKTSCAKYSPTCGAPR
jgi:hypothetical protein